MYALRKIAVCILVTFVTGVFSECPMSHSMVKREAVEAAAHPLPPPSPPSANDMTAILTAFPSLTEAWLSSIIISCQQQTALLFGPSSPFPNLPPHGHHNSFGAFGRPRADASLNPHGAYVIGCITEALVLKLNIPIANIIAIMQNISFGSNCSVPANHPLIHLPPPPHPSAPSTNILLNPIILSQVIAASPCVLNLFRTNDGSCNNPVFPNQGKDSTNFIRLLPADYADGISVPRQSISGNALPSARLVSQTIVGLVNNPSPNYNHLLTQWGQFTDHDLTSTPQTTVNGSSPQCCNVANPNPQCFPIAIAPNDSFYSQFKQTCMQFVRSIPGVSAGCTLGPRNQVNQLSAYIDGGQIYGTSATRASLLRSFKNGLLAVNSFVGRNPLYTLLPGASSSTSFCSDSTATDPCFVTGDSRVNIQRGLQVVHTIMMRYHNSIATKLQALNPTWNDEKVFQETRAIIIAHNQHVTYNEWLPTLMGQYWANSPAGQGLSLMPAGQRFNGYNIHLDPSIATEFSTAAFRVGHTMVTGILDMFSSSGQCTPIGTIRVQDTFFKVQPVYADKVIDQLAIGLTVDHGKVVENNVVVDLKDDLFFNGNCTPGQDLVSLNIQRGRDHGIPGYMSYRRFCGLYASHNFTDLAANGKLFPNVAAQMASIYQSVEDIDLFVAGISEEWIPGGFIGPTFACIITDQFRRLRAGDRFWYENSMPAPLFSFSDAQLAAIRNMSMARTLCDTNTLITEIQAKAFQVISPTLDRFPIKSAGLFLKSHFLLFTMKLILAAVRRSGRPKKLSAIAAKKPTDQQRIAFLEETQDQILTELRAQRHSCFR